MELTNIQIEMNKLAESYSKKIDDQIKEKEFFKFAMKFVTESGRIFNINISENVCNRNKNFIYLKEVVNSKQVRIPKSEW